MFAPDNTPATGPPGDGQTYLDLDGGTSVSCDSADPRRCAVTFRRQKAEDDCLAGPCVVQAIIFHNEELENVHRAADSGVTLCECCPVLRRCSELSFGAAILLHCQERGAVRLQVPWRVRAHISATVQEGCGAAQRWNSCEPADGASCNGTEFAVSLHMCILQRFAVEKTGLHYLMYSSCQLEAGTVFIEGHNTWMNPYGYVSGELYYNMPVSCPPPSSPSAAEALQCSFSSS